MQEIQSNVHKHVAVAESMCYWKAYNTFVIHRDKWQEQNEDYDYIQNIMPQRKRGIFRLES